MQNKYLSLSNKKIALAKNNESSDALTNLIIDAIQDIKGKDIVKFDLRHLEDANSDYFIVCHGTSNTQIAGILNNVQKRVFEELGLRPIHVEGKGGTTWMLVDYFSVVVHVFSRERRIFYNLEDLWSDGKVTYYDDID